MEPETAQELVSLVMTGLGREGRNTAVYSTLIELMANTREHASGKDSRTPWYTTASFDKTKGKGYFAFVDNGVGILNSINLRPLRRMARRAGLKSNADFMQNLLSGEIGSRTGVHYRGKGLPNIKAKAEMGSLHGLVIITNDVYADISRDSYELFKPAFSGTLLAWEVTYGPGL